MYFNKKRIIDMCKYSYLSNKTELEVNEIYNLYSNYRSTIINNNKFDIFWNITNKPIYIENKSSCDTSCFVFKETITDYNQYNNQNNNNQNNIIVSFNNFNNSNNDSNDDSNYKKSTLQLPDGISNYFNLQPKICNIYNKNFEHIKDNLTSVLDKLVNEHFNLNENNTINNITNLNSCELESSNEKNTLLVKDPSNTKENLESLSYNIIFCGHNTGGGLAQIASLYYKFLYPNANIYCVSFGNPRIGNYKFNKLFKKHVDEYIRIVHINDIAPLTHSCITYSHHKNVLYIGNDNKNKNSIYIKIMKNVIFSLLNICKNTYCSSYKQYNIMQYLDYLEKL